MVTKARVSEISRNIRKTLTSKFSGVTRYDENGHPVALSGTRQRAEELFDVYFPIFSYFNKFQY